MNGLNDHAVSYAVLDGKLTFRMLPFRPLMVEDTIGALEELSPHWKWVEIKSGRVHKTMPEAYRRQMERLEVLGVEGKPAYEQVSLWTASHNAFCLLDPITLGVTAAGEASAEIAALVSYFDQRPDDLADRWTLFRQLVSTNLSSVWWDAYNATRDTSLNGDPALASTVTSAADPKDASAANER